mgnify:CR=1 FL=1|tara:strand:- start:14076 stop:15866 length:1791 start_codon:yes stop_codon:yes gene_type:complete
MNEIKLEAPASLLSELLLYHAALGRGYISPFPVTRGLVYTSALPGQALLELRLAEDKFLRWHKDLIADDVAAMELAEAQPKEVQTAMHGSIGQLKAKKEKLSRYPYVTWKDDSMCKSTFVEVLKQSYYGAYTYIDQAGGRLATAIVHSIRLANDLTLYTMTEGTSDEVFIRANGNGGSAVHALSGRDAIFNFFSNCNEKHLDRLIDRIKNSASGHHGIGQTITIGGREVGFSGTSENTLHTLMRNVFRLGEGDPEKRVKVMFSRESADGWRAFLKWGLSDIIEEESPSEWQVQLSESSPASTTSSVLFAARAAMVAAFIETVEGSPGAGMLKVVELGEDHLILAKRFARLIYCGASGHESYSRRVDNLKPSKTNFITPQKLAVAKQAMYEAILSSEPGRVSRRAVTRDIEGVTLGLCDELVRTGAIAELRGVEECQLGRTTRAYALPQDAPAVDVGEAMDEFQECMENYRLDSGGYDEAEALRVYDKLQHKAAAACLLTHMPVVPLSKMRSDELGMLPKLLDMFPKSLVLRGVDRTPEPERLFGEGSPLDKDGMHLWVRYKPGTNQDFYDWDVAGKLQLSEYWGEAVEDIPPVVPD